MRAPRRGLLLAFGASVLVGCSYYDGHVETLPQDVEAALAERAKETPEERERINSDPEEIVIGTITILPQTVLPASDFFSPLLNNVHYVTQPDVIYHELDFKEGDKIPRYKLYDAERYIRLLDPIKQARVVTKKNEQTGKTDVVVVTQDHYTPQLSFGAKGSGGYSSFGVNVFEPSMFGRLYTWGASYTRENFRDYLNFSAGKTRINGSRWQTEAAAIIGFSDSQYNYAGYGLTLAHPFTRNGQKHGFVFNANNIQGVNYDYLGGGIRKGFNTDTGQLFSLVYRTKIEDVSAQYLYGIGRNNRVEFGPGLWHYIRRDYYISPADQYSYSDTPEFSVSAISKAFYQPQQFSTHAATFTVNTRNGNYVPMKNFRQYMFTEDQFEGLRTSTKVVHANPSLGLNDHYTAPATSVTYQVNSPDQVFRLESGASRSARVWHNVYAYPTDDLWTFDLRAFYFTRFGTIAVREFVAEGYHLTRDVRTDLAHQFTRGFYYGTIYPAAGNLTSLEYRSPPLKLPYILVAGVLFMDYAGVGERLRSLDYYTIVGFGLRTMIYEFDNNVFRIDFGLNITDPTQFSLLNALQFGLSHTF